MPQPGQGRRRNKGAAFIMGDEAADVMNELREAVTAAAACGASMTWRPGGRQPAELVDPARVPHAAGGPHKRRRLARLEVPRVRILPGAGAGGWHFCGHGAQGGHAMGVQAGWLSRQVVLV